jgi:hypothetical protein
MMRLILKPMANARRKMTPHSRLLKRGCVDGRTREGKFLSAVRAELAQQVGGDPTPSERAIIERVSWLRLHLTLLDEKVGAGGILTDHDVRHYLAYNNSVVRAMARLGHKAAPAAPSLAEYLASKHGEVAAA